MNGIDRQLSDCSDESEPDVPIATSSEISTNTIQIRVNMKDKRTAEIVYNSVVVDKEPKRSSAVRNLSTNNNFIIAEISSPDAKYLQKSADNFFEMCELSRSVIERVGAYKFKEELIPPENKAAKNKLKRRT